MRGECCGKCELTSSTRGEPINGSDHGHPCLFNVPKRFGSKPGKLLPLLHRHFLHGLYIGPIRNEIPLASIDWGVRIRRAANS